MENNFSIWKTAQGLYMIEWYEKHQSVFSPTDEYLKYFSDLLGVNKEKLLEAFKKENKKYGH